MIDKEKLKKNIIRIKKLVATAVQNEDKLLLIPLTKLNKEVVLVVAKFKCQKCGKKEKLQLHHMILRMSKKYMDLWRYISQRHYWANQIILCEGCHCKFHNSNPSSNDLNDGMISKIYIDKIKRKYKK